ncbi:MAG: hypothetical protein RL497_3140, partial [Pseudomonadota bacterium]
MELKFSGTYESLVAKLTSLEGDWDDSQPNKKVLRLNGGVMNWFESTGRIQFQGRDPGKSVLEEGVPKRLYPAEAATITSSKTLTAPPRSQTAPLSEKPSLSIEKQYLTSGINQGDLIIGIVSSVGTEYKRVTEPLTDRLQGFGYNVEEIRVSSCLPSFAGSGSREYERIKHYMKAGDSLRESSDNNAILAAGVAKQISESRNQS